MIVEEEAVVAIAACAYMYCLAALVLLKWERDRLRRWWVRPIIRKKEEGEFETIFQKMKNEDGEALFEYCRLEKYQYDTLLAMVQSHLRKRSIREPISPEKRLVITLRFLAHGGSFKALAWSFRIGRSTAMKIVTETCDVLWRVVGGQYARVPSGDDWRAISNDFWNMWNFPNCVGAIDGKHCALKAPPRSGSEWYNYKGFNSCVLMAACDAKYRFIWVDCGGYGSRSDGGLFAESDFGKAILDGTLALPNAPLPGTNELMPSWFVADAAFPLKANIMRPYPGRQLTREQDVFNYRLSRARRVIENAFGILVARWAVLQNKISGVPSTACKYVLAAVALHNFIMKTSLSENSRYTPYNFLDRDENGVTIAGEIHNAVGALPHQDLQRFASNNPTRRAIQVRERLKEYLNEEGAVEWQERAISRGRFFPCLR